MEGKISQDFLRVRPFGGVAIYVKQIYAQCTRLVRASDRYIIIKVNDAVVVNVYLPMVMIILYKNITWNV